MTDLPPHLQAKLLLTLGVFLLGASFLKQVPFALVPEAWRGAWRDDTTSPMARDYRLATRFWIFFAGVILCLIGRTIGAQAGSE